MPSKPCSYEFDSGRLCGALSDQSRCPKHRRARNASWSKDRDHASHKRFARAVLKAAGHQCQFVAKNGQRCLVINQLHAHHLEPGNDDPAKGVCLCRYHHRMVDSHAR